MKYPICLTSAGLIFALATAPADEAEISNPVIEGKVHATAKQPNIVLILADDMGYSDIGCYGGEIETPHLDSLASSGLRFTDYYVNNMCWPTRASIMTGLYPRTALPFGGSADGGLHAESATLPQQLRSAGYTTLMSGKWHLSSAAEPDGPNAPHHRGFDHFYGTIDGASDFFAPRDLQRDGKSMTHEWKDNPNYYYTDALTTHALDFLQKADEEKPFFLYVTYTSAHWPLHAKADDIAHYKGKYAMGWDKLRSQRHAKMKELGVVDPNWELSPRHPQVPAWEGAEHQAWQQRRMEVYAAQVTCMDRNIGRLVDHLKKSGEFDNTLILFQHDNGACHVEYGPERTGPWTREFTTDGKKLPIRPGNVPTIMPGAQDTFQSYGYGWANASNTPFRLFKKFDHEGGTRSPLIASWPAGLNPEQAGGLHPQVSHAIDLMPTLLDVAAVLSNRAPQNPFPFEGRSLFPSFKEEVAKATARRPIYWAHRSGKGIRIGDWKLVSAARGRWELYHLVSDGTELHDLAEKMPDKVGELAKLHAEWKARTSLSMKKPGKPKN